MRNGLIAVRETTVHGLRAEFEGTPLTVDQQECKVLVVLSEAVGGDAGAAVRYMRESGAERLTFYRKTGLVLESVVEEKVSVRRVSEAEELPVEERHEMRETRRETGRRWRDDDV